MDITFTTAATDQVKELLDSDMVEDASDGLYLRVFIEGGGCSGFQYGFAFDRNITEDDYLFTENDVMFIVDSMSGEYLDGAVIDYKKNLMGSQFTIENPNAQTTCGCGSSFQV